MLGGESAFARVVVLTVGVGVVLAGWGCGSDPENDSVKTTSSRAAPTNDEEQIKAVLREIQEDYDAGDGEAYCRKLIEGERQEVAAFGRNFGRGSSCVETIRTSSMIGGDKEVKQNPTILVSVRVEGERAVAEVRNGGRPPESMIFLKRGSEWKVVESGFEPDPLAPSAR